MTRESRFSRNELLFGADGQARIGAVSVAIIGLGGLGSHVAQQLAYLGTVRFVLVDNDRVTLSNLNRLIGAGPEDAVAGRPKVTVAERQVRFIRPEAEVRALDTDVAEGSAKEAVASCDVVFGCVDQDPPRLALVELTSRTHIPYFDLATDVGDDGRQYGGRVLVSIAGERCLFCMDMLDQEALREVTQTPEQRSEDERIYGIRRAAARTAGPSVVSLNGVVASLATTEYMVWVTDLRPPKPHLIYHGERGLVIPRQDAPAPSCPYCGR